MEGFGHGDYWRSDESIKEIARVVDPPKMREAEAKLRSDAIRDDAVPTDACEVDVIPPEIILPWLARVRDHDG